MRIGAELRREDAGTDMLVLQVADTGPGIAREDQGKIFETYTQFTDEAHAGRGGLGLGLSFVRRIVTMLGGAIAVDSEPGQGATFEVSLPVEAV